MDGDTQLRHFGRCAAWKHICPIPVYHLPRGARGVVVIVVGNEHGDTSSNPGRDRLHFT